MNFEHCLWMWQIILPHIVVQTCIRASEVRNTGSCRNSGAGHYDYIFNLPIANQISHPVDIEAFQNPFVRRAFPKKFLANTNNSDDSSLEESGLIVSTFANKSFKSLIKFFVSDPSHNLHKNDDEVDFSSKISTANFKQL
uniref:Uncharacterized protein n=1 Tax=Romanomermis culicivorax TaxID=13658 RepID=A0A915KKY4_ROMCU